jgi:hypothetical protein
MTHEIGISLITPTGMRPESLKRCAQYVARFDHSFPVQWIVVDDGEKTSIDIVGDVELKDITLSFIRPNHRWQHNANTLALNILEALPHIFYGYVAFIEDDDFYSQHYLTHLMNSFEQGYLIIGETPSRYYHVPTKQYRVLENQYHASLCQTAISSKLLTCLEAVLTASNGKFIDVTLWNEAVKLKRYGFYSNELVVGMKGLPGRPGIGIGHRPEQGSGWRSDIDQSVLKQWLGPDAVYYLNKNDPPRSL